jgi:hypothetical protein
MAITAGTVVRTAVVLGAVGYCAWPGDAASGPVQAARLPAVSNAILSPAILPPPRRNPFRTADAPPLLPAGSGAAASGPTSRSARSGSKGKAADSATADRQADPFASLLLNATSICGNQRMAMINGRIYQPGASLAGLGRSAKPLVVEQILPYKVLLCSEGRVIELRYADRVRRTEPARQGPASQRPSHSPPLPAEDPPGKTAPARPSNPNRTGRSQAQSVRHD